MSELASVDWSRAQFALTALYHFIFVPLTLGLSFMLAFMETIYYKTGNEEWKKITKFWLKLFGINFAIGVATGIIMEFEFGTNWANYSWFVGDIFGAPLAIEGMLAFFLEATFFAVMFFGWEKVSKRFHLISTWMVAIGSNLSALWILIANGWMQNPVGTTFNPETARNEMTNFFEIALSPLGIVKFLHTITAGYVTSALFVIGVSAWFLLKKRDVKLAKKSMIIGASFGLIASILVALVGDESGHQVAKNQPMKLAAMESLYVGNAPQGLVAFGIVNPKKHILNNEDPLLFEIEIPYALSFLANRHPLKFVPGIEDLVYGNEEQGIESTASKMQKGKIAVEALKEFKIAKKENNQEKMDEARILIDENMKFLGYGYLQKPEDVVPPVALVFYSFRVMVGLGVFFIALFAAVLFTSLRTNISKKKWLLRISFLSIPLGFIAAEAGWIVAEVGRQPWAIQDLMPVHVAATNLASTNIMLSFAAFAVLFTVLFIAEIKIMITQIKKGF